MGPSPLCSRWLITCESPYRVRFTGTANGVPVTRMVASFVTKQTRTSVGRSRSRPCGRKMELMRCYCFWRGVKSSVPYAEFWGNGPMDRFLRSVTLWIFTLVRQGWHLEHGVPWVDRTGRTKDQVLGRRLPAPCTPAHHKVGHIKGVLVGLHLHILLVVVVQVARRDPALLRRRRAAPRRRAWIGLGRTGRAGGRCTQGGASARTRSAPAPLPGALVSDLPAQSTSAARCATCLAGAVAVAGERAGAPSVMHAPGPWSLVPWVRSRHSPCRRSAAGCTSASCSQHPGRRAWSRSPIMAVVHALSTASPTLSTCLPVWHRSCPLACPFRQVGRQARRLKQNSRAK
jgi:hypothetical protein